MTFRRPTNRTLLLAACAVAGSALGSGALMIWQTSRAISDSAGAIAIESRIAFEVRTPQASAATPFETISSPAPFRGGALFDGSLFLAGATRIVEYNPDGEVRREYRAGLDLPAAPPAAMAAGLSTEAGEQALYVATAGEGLLVIGGSAEQRSVKQLRAVERDFRDLTAVLPLATGRVLAGSEKRGVLVYDGKNWGQFHPSLSDFHVTALEGTEGDLWIGTLDRGVYHWTAGTPRQFTEQDGLPDPQVLAIAIDGESAYIGTPLGVSEFRDGRFARELAPGTLAQTLLVAGRRLLIGTLDEGVIEIPLDVRPPRGPRPVSGSELGGAGNAIHRLIALQGEAYALADDGVYQRAALAGGWRPVLQPAGAVLTDRNIAALSVDPAGKLWIGYFDRGIDILEPLTGGRARHVEDEHVFCINRIVHHAERDATLVATANGLVFFDSAGNKRQVMTRGDGLIATHITDIAVTADSLAVATPAGITIIDAAGPRSLYAFHGLVNNHVYTLAAAGQRLFAGTLGGMSVLDADVVEASYTTANSPLRQNWITAIVPFGDDWFVGTYGAGIFRLNALGTWNTFPEASAAFEVNPNAMAASSERVYAGTLGRGLWVYQRSTGRWTAVTAGLPSHNVTALALADGYLNVGTDNGLVRIREAQLIEP